MKQNGGDDKNEYKKCSYWCRLLGVGFVTAGFGSGRFVVNTELISLGGFSVTPLSLSGNGCRTRRYHATSRRPTRFRLPTRW